MDRIQKLMLEFEPFSLPALKNALKYIKNNPSLCSDLSAGYLYMWHEGADVRFCVWNDTFVVCQTIGEQRAFSYPIGGDPDGMIDELIEYTYDNHLPLRFLPSTRKHLKKSAPINVSLPSCGHMTGNGVTIFIPLKRRWASGERNTADNAIT